MAEGAFVTPVADHGQSRHVYLRDMAAQRQADRAAFDARVLTEVQKLGECDAVSICAALRLQPASNYVRVRTSLRRLAQRGKVEARKLDNGHARCRYRATP